MLVVGTSNLAIAVTNELAARGVDVHHQLAAAAHDGVRAAIFCDDDDVANITAAIELHDDVPDLRIVLRSFNSRIQKRLPELLGDCRVLSASLLAAPALCDLAVGIGGPDSGPRRRTWLVRTLDRVRGSDLVAVTRQLWRRQLLRWLLLAMALLMLAQALVAHAAFDYDLQQSVHVGISSIATLGFADAGLAGSRLAAQPVWIQVAGVATMLLDIVLITVLLGLIADALVGERFARVFGGSSRRLRGHVVVAGLGTVGYRVVRELTERGYRCAAIEADEDGPFVAGARRLGASVTIADVRHEDAFAQLSIDRAVAVIAATSDDAANLEAAFTAMSIAPEVPVVVRCFDPGLAARLERLDGIAASRSVARLAAPAFVDAALDM
ncbi:MAG: TrkA-N domain protein [Thermoleophilia bacterium]|nr:TrkA-N domain protein [Thermoleophilia bacterium]